jgi:nicotinamide mononucleotide transporter
MIDIDPWVVLEWASALAGLVSVVWLIRERRSGWLIQNASSLGYVFVFIHSQLYGLAALQWVFIGLATWAWWHWHATASQKTNQKTNQTNSKPPIAQASFQEMVLLCLISAALTALMGYFWLNHTDSKTPYLEAAISAGSLVAQWLMSRQKVQTWIWWFVVNVGTVGICWRDQLWATAILYALFAALAIWGWLSWRKAS